MLKKKTIITKPIDIKHEKYCTMSFSNQYRQHSFNRRKIRRRRIINQIYRRNYNDTLFRISRLTFQNSDDLYVQQLFNGSHFN